VTVLNSTGVAAQESGANFDVTLTEFPRLAKLSQPVPDLHNNHDTELNCTSQVGNTTYVYKLSSVVHRIDMRHLLELSARSPPRRSAYDFFRARNAIAQSLRKILQYTYVLEPPL
jgi:hypothetical protein